MKSRKFILDNKLEIVVAKRASSRRIKLTIGSDGVVKASIPRWLPYSAAIEFARSKMGWIEAKLPEPKILESDRQIGKSHRLVFTPTDKSQITTRLGEQMATVFYPKSLDPKDPNVQKAAKRVIRRALLAEAEILLPIRLKQLAEQYGYSYKGLRIKSLKTRWGSCDSHQVITLNLYLMELPWELIDYVIVHELNHTKIMAHGPKFWQAMSLYMPNYQQRKKQLKVYPTSI